ncbi:MAG: carbamoyl-phosphate synthase large subunit [Candidatus Altiarchaeota archaeon]
MTCLKKVLVIGSGPIRIGQAAEFDYSGSQACLSLREEGIKTVLVNSNPATIQTDFDVSDIVYLEPLNVESLERIIDKERPDAILPTMGGQTGLNLATQLHDAGILKKYDVKVIGTKIDAIKEGEGREEFAELMRRIKQPIPNSKSVKSLDDALAIVSKMGYPVIIRPGYTLGGTGGGIAYNEQQFIDVTKRGLSKSFNHEVLIEEYVGGWKEIEYEVMRDSKDNCITICNMENFDPMGIHTGESIVAAPSQTLTDHEYQMLRDASIKIIRALRIEGGCNIQFALDPNSEDYKVIEVNPRLSRSSALASKATGYPIARVAAKIAVGYSLDQIRNEVTKTTPASFEPALDYIVVKIPRWPFDKFKGLGRVIGTEMRSTGEVMAIGRNFEEALQKAIRSLDIGRSGICDNRKEITDRMTLMALLKNPTDLRIFHIYDALKNGFSVEEVHSLTQVDRFFLEKIMNILRMEARLRSEALSGNLLLDAKRIGFSDRQIAFLRGLQEAEIRKARQKERIKPVFKLVDTCAAEFEAKTPYYYSTYGIECEANPSTKKKVIILGSGPIRIGQGIEFDYCTVHAVSSAREEGFETIIINNNPETVSTDFDTSDKLYFEPITVEDVLNIVQKEEKGLAGVIVQFGGQTAINISSELAENGVQILGTSTDNIDRTEDRGRFGKALEKLGIDSPKWDTAYTFQEAIERARNIGYPLLLRPSYVLGGQSMKIVYSEDELREFVDDAMAASPKQQILLDKFLEDAVEVDVDAVSDGVDTYIGGIMEHIEAAGIHSGDSACAIPPQTLSAEVIGKIVDCTLAMAKEFKVKGLINMQYAVKDGKVYVLEANPRASRTVPFVSKATGVQLAKVAAKVMLGRKLKDIIHDFEQYKKIKHVAIKEVLLPFDKLRVDPLLGPEMHSTGETMGIDKTFGVAFYKAMSGAEMELPVTGRVFISVADVDKDAIVKIAKDISNLGFQIVSTSGTYNKLVGSGIQCERVPKVSEGSPNILDEIMARKIALIINTQSREKVAREDGRQIRMNAVSFSVPYITTLTGARAAVQAIKAIKSEKITTKSLNDYF